MPERPVLKFKDAIEARAWITDPNGEPQDLRQKITHAIVTYQASRPDTGRRAYLQEGAERFTRAARLAHSLLLEAESTRTYGASVRPDGALPKRLRRALQACDVWIAERESLAMTYFWFHKALDARGYRTEGEFTPEVSLARMMGPGLFRMMGPGDGHEDRWVTCHKSGFVASPEVPARGPTSG